MLRLFIALELSDQQKKEMHELQQRTKQYLKGVRWVRPQGMHLTLKFLGDTEESRVEQVQDILKQASEQIDPFAIKYGSSGVFPGPKKARVLWVGLKDGEEKAKLLANILEEGFCKIGFKKEKRHYSPHLTIGRLRNPQPEEMVKKYLEKESTFLSSSVEAQSVILYQSKISVQGAEYTVLCRKSFH